MPTARFFFDAGSGGVLWLASDPADPDLLPISDGLRVELAQLVALYDQSINWDYPPDPGPWTAGECAAFDARARSALARLRSELGPSWTIADEMKPLSGS